MMHSFKEPRLLWKNRGPEESNVEALLAIDPAKDVSAREKFDLKFREDMNSAANRIRGIKTKWTTWIGSRFSAEEADKKSVDAGITKIAQERAKLVRTNISANIQHAERTLYEKGVNTTNSLTILETKQTVCAEVIADLQAEINDKQALRQSYQDALGELGKLKDKHTDAPALKGIEMKLNLVEAIKADTERQIAERKTDENIARIGRAHENLKTFLIGANPALAINIDRMLLDNAAGVNKDLLKAIDALTSTDKTERAMLKDIAKHMQLRFFGGANNNAIREFYQAQTNTTATVNADRLDDRLKGLYDKAPTGQSVLVVTENGNLTFGVIRKEDEGRKKVILVNNQGKQVAVIDVAGKKLTIRKGANEFVHLDLAPTLPKGPSFDPTQIRFQTKNTIATAA